MCGRYVRKLELALLAKWFEVLEEELDIAAPTWNAAPQSFQPVVRASAKNGRREAALLRWGLVPAWARDARIGQQTINARSEEAAGKPAFREALKQRRCLVPADAYYEWKPTGAKSKQPYAIALESGEPMGFAGLWESWRDPAGGLLESFSILTTQANEALRDIHDRMPVILERNEYSRWLAVGDAPVELMRPLPARKLKAWPVSTRVGNVRHNDATLLEPVQLAQKPEQGTLF